MDNNNTKYEYQSIFRTLAELKDLGSKTIKNIDRFKSRNDAIVYFHDRGLDVQGYRKNYDNIKEDSKITCEEWLNLDIPNIAYMPKRRAHNTDVMSVCMINTIYDLAQLIELDRIETAMKALAWSWYDTGIPDKKQILYRAVETLVDVVDSLDLEKLSNLEQTGFVMGIGGGGFNAEIHAYYREDYYSDTDIISSFGPFCVDDIKINGKPVMFTMSLTFELTEWSLDTPRVFNPDPIDLPLYHNNTDKIGTCPADNIDDTIETPDELNRRTTVYLHSQLSNMGMIKDYPIDVLYDLLDKVIVPNCIMWMSSKPDHTKKSLADDVYEYVSKNKMFIEYILEHSDPALNVATKYSNILESQT